MGRTLDEAEGEPVVLLGGASRSRVTRDPDDPTAAHAPEAVPEGPREIAGVLPLPTGRR